MVLVVVSGYFNPLHAGHLEYFRAARALGDMLWVIVNNDGQVALKGAVPFMPAQERLQLVSGLSVVDMAVLSQDDDRSVRRTLGMVNAAWWALCGGEGAEVVFANGGDQTVHTVPEAETCRELGVREVYGVCPQLGQSSDLIRRAHEWLREREHE